MTGSRRQFMKGVTLGTGTTVLAPLMQQIEAHATGDEAALPKRFVFVIKSSGLPPAAVRPKGVEIGDGRKLIDRPLKDHKLSEPFQSLEPFKDHTMILEGLSGANFTGNHSSYYGALSCHNADHDNRSY